MDRRPLLSSNRESAQRTGPPPPTLLPASQLDASLVVFEDDVADSASANRNAGPSSDTRTSFFSSLSFAAWSDSSAGVTRSAATRPYVVAQLLRPFQRLRFWCSDDHEGEDNPSRFCLCCCCRRRSSSSASNRDNDSDVDDGIDVPADGVAADALRASGVSQNSHRSKTSTPTTMPHRGSGRQHRQYAPPRPRSNEANLDRAGSPTSTVPAEQTAGLHGAHDSVTGSSFAGSSSPPSSVAFGRVATAPGEQLVMQHGVLMRIAADGTCTRVADSSAAPAGADGEGKDDGYAEEKGGDARRGSQPHTTAQNPDAISRQSLQLDVPPQATLWGGPLSMVSNTADVAAGVAAVDDPYALTMAMSALEAAHQPLRTLDQLSTSLNRFTPYLPLRVEAEVDLNSASALPANPQPGLSMPASPTSLCLPVVPVCLHVLGPVQSCATAAALRILEDVLLEDCDAQRIGIHALHCADLDLRGVSARTEDPSSLAGRPSNGSSGGPAMSTNGRQSNAFLDLLVSPQDGSTHGSAGELQRGATGNASSANAPLTSAAASTHVLAFLKNIVRGRGPQLTTLHFTRCFVVPHDVGRFVPLPLRTVRRLRYEHCSLTPAHVDALLTLARHQDAERRSGLRGASSGAPGDGAFSALEELQLSGPLTSECVAELLDYIEEQQVARVQGTHTPPALRQVILPSALVRAAREHPFVQANYQRIRVFSGH